MESNNKMLQQLFRCPIVYAADHAATEGSNNAVATPFVNVGMWQEWHLGVAVGLGRTHALNPSTYTMTKTITVSTGLARRALPRR